ncbi:hypothetical protein E4U32_001243 [Claviceps aff. humidiphila group G2b]|nr:hypothetical protein E4U32_001243 [Claviceps aff. humidiphila group G2b]
MKKFYDTFAACPGVSSPDAEWATFLPVLRKGKVIDDGRRQGGGKGSRGAPPYSPLSSSRSMESKQRTDCAATASSTNPKSSTRSRSTQLSTQGSATDASNLGTSRPTVKPQRDAVDTVDAQSENTTVVTKTTQSTKANPVRIV